MEEREISKAVITRLPRYYRYLGELLEGGVERISSNELSLRMRVTASQIRQDLSCFGEFGQQGYGYNVDSLRGQIAEILGMTHHHTAVILGVGNLGRALMENFPFHRSGFDLTAAFDVAPELIGKRISNVSIYPVSELERYLREHPTSVGVLTLPQSAAVQMSELLVAGGVKGIWNFTNSELHLENTNVIVENVHFADSLLTLSYLISEET